MSIGRAHDVAIRLTGDTKVSSHHCVVHNRGGSFSVEDTGSTNGTHVNGRRIRAREVPIRDGDTLRVGKTELRFCVAAPKPDERVSLFGRLARFFSGRH